MSPLKSVCVQILILVVSLVAGHSASAQIYKYDGMGRLTEVTYPSGARISYDYDRNSNITRILHEGATALLPPDGVIDTPVDDISIETGESVDFTATAGDPDGAIPLTFLWDFDGGATDSTEEDPGPTTFNTAGTYTVTFNVTDATGLADPTPDTVTVTVSSAPPAGGGGNGSSRGGGSVLWMPLLLALIIVRRLAASSVLLCLVAGTALAADWAPMSSPTTQSLNAVWGTSPDAVWAVGHSGTILFYDGDTWSTVDSGVTASLNGVWGRSADDVYAVGDDNTFLHYDGNNWTAQDIGVEASDFVDIWSAGPGEDLWLIGTNRAWFFDGSTWTGRSFNMGLDGVSLTPAAKLTSIGGTANFIIVTATQEGSSTRGRLFVNFRQIASFDTNDIYAFSDRDMYAVGVDARRLNDGDATNPNTGNWQILRVNANAVWGSSPDNMFAVGQFSTQGRIFQYDGNASNQWTVTHTQDSVSLEAVYGFGPADVFAVGTGGTILRYNDGPTLRTADNYRFSGMATDSVNAFTGELIHAEVDLSVGHLMPVTFERYYASGLQSDTRVGGALGRNWTHSFEWRLITRMQNNVRTATVISPRGRVVDFLDVGGSWQQESLLERPYTLLEENGHFTFADPDTELIYRFISNQLATIEDRNGNRLYLSYIQGSLVSVDDRKGNEIVLEYSNTNELGRIYTVGSQSAELDVQYTYADGNLTRVQDPMGRVTTLSYVAGRETEALLESLSLPSLSNRVWAWNDERRVVTETVVGGGDIEIEYANTATEVTTPDDVTRSYDHDDDGTLRRFDDGAGGITSYEYDSDGRRTRMTDRLGREFRWTYAGGSFKVGTATRPDDAEFVYHYEPNSSSAGVTFYDLTRVEKPDATVVAATFDEFGNRLTWSDEAENSWSWTYNTEGQVKTATNPEGGTTTFEYWSHGALQDVTDHFNNRTRLLYDGYRRLTTIEFPDGSRRLVELNDRGDISQVTSVLGEVYEYSYDENGLLSQLMSSSGAYRRVERDGQGKITRFIRPGENGEAYTDATYDAMARLATVTRPGEPAMQLDYNAIGQLENVVDQSSQTWTINRDAENTLKSIDPPGEDILVFDNSSNAQLINTRATAGNEQVAVELDSMNRVVAMSNALEQRTVIERDKRGLVTGVARPEPEPGVAVRTAFEHDALGNTTKITDPEGGEWENRRDAMGRISEIVDPLDKVTKIRYGVGNRPNQIEFPDGAGNVTLDTNAAGQLTRENYSDGTSIELDRDTQGRPVSGTNLVIGHNTRGNLDDSNGVRISYDDLDRIRRITMADGRYIDYFYERGYLVRIVDWLGGETLIERNARGQATSFALPNGLTNGYGYDRAGRVIIIDFGANGYISLARRWDGNVEQATRDLPGPQTVENLERNFDFDTASRIEAFQYDVLGNLLQDDETRYEFNLASQLTAVDGNTGRVELEWDAFGRPTAEIRPGSRKELVWNYALSDERIAVERENGVDSWYYVYTTSGRLLYRISADGVRQHYHFDEDGNTVFITNDAGQIIQTYFYSPLGEVLDSSGNVDNAWKKHAQQGAKDLTGDDIIYQKGDTGIPKIGVSTKNKKPTDGSDGPADNKNVVNEASQDESPQNDSTSSLSSLEKDLLLNGQGVLFSTGELVVRYLRRNPDVAQNWFGSMGGGIRNWGAAGSALFKSLGGLTAGLSGYTAYRKAQQNADGLYLTDEGRVVGSVSVGLVNGLYGAHPVSGGFVFGLNVLDYAAQRLFGVDLGATNLGVNRVGEVPGALTDVVVMWMDERPGSAGFALDHHGRHVLKKEGFLPKVVGFVGGEMLGSQLGELWNFLSGERLREAGLVMKATSVRVERALESWFVPAPGPAGY